MPDGAGTSNKGENPFMDTQDFFKLVDDMTPEERAENFDELLLLAMGNGDGGDTNQSSPSNEQEEGQ
jgi:hypothetical protein